ncbi:MAG: YfgM family protein [Enterobacteriaceae bacterium]
MVRRFFRENGKAILFGLVVGFGALFGWKYWQGHRGDMSAQRAAEYEQVSKEVEEGTPERLAQAEKFVQGNDNNYGVFAALQLARKLVNEKHYDKAIVQLQTASKYASEPNLHALIALRLARLQWQEKQYDAALKTLSELKEGGWSAQMENIRGDILLAKGDQAGAQDAYKKGIGIQGTSQALKNLMQIKLNNLSS